MKYTKNNPIVIGTRGSKLALWQAHFTQKTLEENGFAVKIVIIKTQGDNIQHLSFDKLEGKGFFTKEIETALLQGEIDLAVHSHKDLPTTPTPELEIAACSYREDPADILLIKPEKVNTQNVFSLENNTLVGTSSPRRKEQLLLLNPSLRIENLRGNVPTRINKLREGQYDAIVLASAGIKRLGIDLSDFFVHHLPLHEMIPAPAQGVLAYQIRENDADLARILQQYLHNSAVQQAIAVERKILNLLEGGCQLPVGVHCHLAENNAQVWACFGDEKHTFKRVYKSLPYEPSILPQKIVAELTTSAKRNIFISRNLQEHSLFRQLIEKAGHSLQAESLLQFEPINTTLPQILCEWVFFTSKKAVHFWAMNHHEYLADKKLAAIGQGTANALQEAGFSCHFIGKSDDAAMVAATFLKETKAKTVLFPQAQHSVQSIQRHLPESVRVYNFPVYKNTARKNVLIQPCDIAVLTSPLNAAAFFEQYTAQNSPEIVAIGKTTQAYIQQNGTKNCYKSYATHEVALADTCLGLATAKN
ncbi:MAG: hydroxymethylbilane synthase [Chitinophagales bacterium]|nr:hydroxymethylbilane synthase [Bacteroidota bacterium]MCB9042314.1 hydroxymethylbilane synthase [Chitinophagales bacterium]